jgi:signal transduction histidine kinase
VLAFIIFHATVGPSIVTLSVIPIITAGWLMGMRVGSLSGLLFILLNALLAYLVGQQFTLQTTGFWIGGAAGVLIGGAVGRISDLGMRVKEARYIELESKVLKEEIAERKQAEAEKLEAIKHVARSVGHDLRNPLTAIRSALYILQSEELTPDGERMLELIDHNIVTADIMIKNLVYFSTDLKLSLSDIDVNSLIQDTLNGILVPENVKITSRYGTIPQAKVDKEQMKRVLSNLFTNALEAMPRGGELIISTGSTGRYIEMKIKNTGVEIASKNLKKLFTPFFTTKAKGMGLGLINAKKIIESHGGTIQIESEEGKGTTVMVKIPTSPNSD